MAEEAHEVEKILQKRTYYRKPQYLVKWKGYPLSEATWYAAPVYRLAAPVLLAAALHRCLFYQACLLHSTIVHPPSAVSASRRPVLHQAHPQRRTCLCPPRHRPSLLL